MATIAQWIQATRPKTLPAAVSPVLVGSAVAWADQCFRWHLTLVALVCAVLIQIVANFVNEVYDFNKGADTAERLGPLRMVAAGIIPPRRMRNAAILLALITFGLGMILVAAGGWLIFIVGILSLLFAWAYTGGPYPLAYLGIADIFVLIFFGLVAVSGTYYVQAGTLTPEAFIAGWAPGLLSMNILGAANIRDIQTDRKVNKITLAVRLGPRQSRFLYTTLTILVFLVNGILFHLNGRLPMLLPLVAIGYAALINRNLYRAQGRELNEVLASTGKLLLLHSFLMSVGFMAPV
jgi:1,4-dihydroxy-2-naphthoate octaprenyltransferase